MLQPFVSLIFVSEQDVVDPDDQLIDIFFSLLLLYSSLAIIICFASDAVPVPYQKLQI